MTFDVRVTPEAHEEIAAHALWWAEHRSVAEALAWFDATYQRLPTLAKMPRRHPFAQENGRVEEELREMHFGIGSSRTHRAIFRIVEQQIDVLSVRHLAQNKVEFKPQ